MRRSPRFCAVAALAAALASALSACGSAKQETPVAESDMPASPASASEATASAAAPPAAFLQCRSCHAVQPGQHGVGPSLFGVHGKKAGELAGYTFTDAMKNSGLTWDDATLDTWLASPAKLVPGTKMVYAGQADAAKRKEIIDYLKTLK
jgi:cytochrome c